MAINEDTFKQIDSAIDNLKQLKKSLAIANDCPKQLGPLNLRKKFQDEMGIDINDIILNYEYNDVILDLVTYAQHLEHEILD